MVRKITADSLYDCTSSPGPTRGVMENSPMDFWDVPLSPSPRLLEFEKVKEEDPFNFKEFFVFCFFFYHQMS